MSKKLDEIKKEVDLWDIENVDYHLHLKRALDQAYIVGRDEGIEWLKRNAKIKENTQPLGALLCFSEPYSIDWQSFEAAKTEPSLQP